MPRRTRKHRRRDGLHSLLAHKNATRQAPAAEPETARERIARVQANAAVQIARAAAGQPTPWTLAVMVWQWLRPRLDELLP